MLREVCFIGTHDWYLEHPKHVVSPSNFTTIEKLKVDENGEPSIPSTRDGLSTNLRDVFCVRCRSPYQGLIPTDLSLKLKLMGGKHSFTLVGRRGR